MYDCPDCDGKGRAAHPPTWVSEECYECEGTGKVGRAPQPTLKMEPVRAWEWEKAPGFAQFKRPTEADCPTWPTGILVSSDRRSSASVVPDSTESFESALGRALDRLAYGDRRTGFQVSYRWIGTSGNDLYFEVKDVEP